MTYIELPADADFTAFLSGLTPKVVLADRTANYSKPERQRARFLAQRSRLSREETKRRDTETAILMARIMAQAHTKESD